MMKNPSFYSLSLLLLVLLLGCTARGTLAQQQPVGHEMPQQSSFFLRSTASNTKCDKNTTETAQALEELRRQLRAEGGDGSDAGLLNRLLALAIPVMNAGIAAFVPDPLQLNLDGNLDLGSITILGCESGARFWYNFGGITGLSSLFIDRLQVRSGTEEIGVGLVRTDWRATFDMAIQSLNVLSLDDLGAGFNATLCGVGLSQGVDGGVRTNQPSLGGMVDLAGSICGTALDINFAQILESLQVNYTSVEGYLDNVPFGFNAFVQDATSYLSILMKDELVATVEPTLRPVIEEQMKTGRMLFSPTKLVPINAGFVRNDVNRRVRSFVSTTATALGFRGEGDGEN
jgi:hypothetical protein